VLVYDAPLAPVQSATVPVRNSTHVTSYQRPTLRYLITHQMIKCLMCLKKSGLLQLPTIIRHWWYFGAKICGRRLKCL